MFPSIELGAFRFSAYFLLLTSANVAGVCVVLQLARKARLPELRVLLLMSLALLIGYIGSSALHYLVWVRHYATTPWRISLFSGGAFLGGPLVGFPFLFWLTYRLELPIWKTGDVLVPGLALGHAIGKIGCFAAGCCYGCATTLPVGVVFPQYPLGGVAVHPAQLYETATSFLLFLGLIWMFRRRSFDGQVLLTFFLAYAVIRFGIECFRGDSKRGFFVNDVLSTGQIVSICMFMLAGFGLALRLRYLKARGVAPAVVSSDDAFDKHSNQPTPAIFAVCFWFTCAFLAASFHLPLIVRDLATLPFDFEIGHGLWNTLSLLALAAAGCLMVQQLRPRLAPWHALPLIAILLAFPLQQTLRDGGWGLVLLLLITLAWWADRTGLHRTAGAGVGLAAAFLLFPALLLIHFAARQNWRVVGSAVAAFGVAALLTSMVVGTDAYLSMLTAAIPAFLDEPGSRGGFSIAALASQALEPKAALLAVLIGVAAIVGVCGATSARSTSRRQMDAAFGMSVIGLLLVAPVTHSADCVLLLFSVLLLARELPSGNGPRSVFAVSVFLLWVQPQYFAQAAVIPRLLAMPNLPLPQLLASVLQVTGLLGLFGVAAFTANQGTRTPALSQEPEVMQPQAA